MTKDDKKPLTTKDKILYNFFMVISAVIPCLFLCAYLLLKPFLFTSSDYIIACEGTPLVIFISVPLIFFMYFSLSFFKDRYDMEIPFLQKQKRKDYSRKIKNKEKLKRIKQYKLSNNAKTVCILAICVICLIIPTFSRTVITNQGEIIEYNILNKETKRIEKEQITEIKIIQSKYFIGSNSQRTTVSIKINDNQTYSFSAGYFEKNGLSYFCDLFDSNIILYEDKT